MHIQLVGLIVFVIQIFIHIRIIKEFLVDVIFVLLTILESIWTVMILVF